MSSDWGLSSTDARVFPKGAKVLLAYASQTGTAESIARDLFTANQQVCELFPMGELTTPMLEQYGRQVFVVSTHREGLPPANAADFFAELTRSRPNLSQVQFAVLALGNRSYKKYCQFGRDLFNTLLAAGALPRMLTVEVHNNNAAMIAHWRKKLAETFDLREDPHADWETATVMEARANDAGAVEVTFYIQGLELAPAIRLVVKEASRRHNVVEFDVLPNTDHRFTRILVDGDSKVARALAVTQPGDKWLAKPIIGR